MKTKFIYGLLFMIFSFVVTSNDTYVTPKLRLKNSKKIGVKSLPQRGPSSLKNKKKINLDSDLVTLDEIRVTSAKRGKVSADTNA